ncbi:MAG: Uma2 family endonuclease [Planctomycetaceae bacterium]
MPNTLVKKRTGRKREAAALRMLDLLPDKAVWTEDEYLDISTNHIVEFTDGRVEVLPMPTPYHQAVSRRLLLALDDVVRGDQLGEVFHCPVPLLTGVTKYREPDLLFVSKDNLSKTWETDRRLEKADLVIEILSKGTRSRQRDLVRKTAEYAAAKIPEYWIIDPQNKIVLQYRLRSGKYAAPRELGLDDEIRSPLLPQFRMAVRDLF